MRRKLPPAGSGPNKPALSDQHWLTYWVTKTPHLMDHEMGRLNVQGAIDCLQPAALGGQVP